MIAHSALRLIAALALLFSTPLPATSGSARLDVQATVRPWMTYRLEQRLTNYTVDAAALDRGHVDLPAAAVVTFQTNQPAPCQLRVLDRDVRIRRTGNPSAPFGDRLHLSGASARTPVGISVDCRVLLNAKSPPGIYPLTFILALSPP